jgi:hypothetical protein
MSSIVVYNPFLDATYPIINGWNTSPEVYKQFKLLGHNGLDYSCPVGTPIYAAADGQVTKIQTDSDGYGLHIRITTSWGRVIYAHLSEVCCKLNQKVKVGEFIGRTGNSGFSTTPHLHFEVRQNGLEGNGYNGALDPLPLLALTGTVQEVEQEVPALPAAVDETIDEQGTAVMLGTVLNLREDMDANNDASIFATLSGTRTIPYNAIIATKGGDNWLRIDLWGNTLYCAALVGGVRYVKFNG